MIITLQKDFYGFKEVRASHHLFVQPIFASLDCKCLDLGTQWAFITILCEKEKWSF